MGKKKRKNKKNSFKIELDIVKIIKKNSRENMNIPVGKIYDKKNKKKYNRKKEKNKWKKEIRNYI